MKEILSTLRGKQGETLIESLAAILVFTLSSIIFLTMVSSASHINQTVKAEYAEFQLQQQAIEDESTGSPETLTVSCGSASETFNVIKVATTELTAFYPTESGGAGG